MSSPIFDFSHLSPEERIQLAEELWDSLQPSAVPLTPELAAELRRRREYRRDGDPGQPWRDALDDIEQRGA
jgi:putative addiction module component (TIGR02574 family)